MIETLPQVYPEAIPVEPEEIHSLCQYCYPNTPKFGETVITICGKEVLFDEYVETGKDCRRCLMPCVKCGRCPNCGWRHG